MIFAKNYGNGKTLVAITMTLPLFFLLNGCGKEEDDKDHLKKGIEYLNKGEYEKAKLELKTSNQANKDTAETYYYLALLDEKNNHFRSMRDNLKKHIELSPQHNEARIKLGKVLVLFNDLTQALEQAEVILKNEPQNLEALALKASVLIRQRKYKEALTIIDEILKKDPNYTDGVSLKALIYTERNEIETALGLLDQAIKNDNKDPALRLFMIRLHAKQKDINALIKDYIELVALYPDVQDYKITLAKIYTQAGKDKEAEELFQEIIAKAPDKIELKLLLLDFYEATNKDKLFSQFHKFVDDNQDQPKILIEFANWMISRKNFNESDNVLKLIIDSDNDSDTNLLAKYLLAKNAFQQKNYETANKLIDEILNANSSYDDAKILRAKILLVEGQIEDTIDLLEKISWSKTNSDEINVLLGKALLIKGDKKEADKNFTKALETNPNNLEAFTYVYDKALLENNTKYAKELLEKIIRLQPNNIALLEKLVRINILEKNWPAATEQATKISELPNPVAGDASLFLKGQIFQAQGDCLKAIPLYKGLISKFPQNADVLGSLAICHENIKKRGEMILFTENLLIQNPQNYSAGIVLSELLLLDKKYDKSSALLQNFIAKVPNSPKLYALLTKIKLIQNDNKGAVEIYRQGLQQNPGNLELSFSLATLYEKLGEYDSAIAIYETLLKQNPNLDAAINNLTSILSEHGTDKEKLNKAIGLAEKFKHSDKPNFLDTYGWALIKQGNFAEGLNVLSQVIIAAPDVPTYRYHLGVAQYKNGNTSSAVIEIKQALELEKKNRFFPEKKDAEKFLNEINTSKPY